MSEYNKGIYPPQRLGSPEEIKSEDDAKVWVESEEQKGFL